MYKAIVISVLFTSAFYFINAQDTFKNSTATNQDTITFYRTRTLFWMNKISLYQVGDSVYTVPELKPFIKNNQQAYRLYSTYRINAFVAYSFTGMYLFGVFTLANQLFKNKNVFPTICAVTLTPFLSALYNKKAHRSLRKAIDIYNAHL